MFDFRWRCRKENLTGVEKSTQYLRTLERDLIDIIVAARNICGLAVALLHRHTCSCGRLYRYKFMRKRRLSLSLRPRSVLWIQQLRERHGMEIGALALLELHAWHNWRAKLDQHCAGLCIPLAFAASNSFCCAQDRLCAKCTCDVQW